MSILNTSFFVILKVSDSNFDVYFYWGEAVSMFSAFAACLNLFLMNIKICLRAVFLVIF